MASNNVRLNHCCGRQESPALLKELPQTKSSLGILPSTIQQLEEQDPSTLCMATVSSSPQIEVAGPFSPI